MSMELDVYCQGQGGKGGRMVKIDPADYERFFEQEDLNWRIDPAGYVYAYRKHKRIYLHREILQPGPGLVVDHINRDTLDNRRANLREVTQQHNVQNRARVNRDNTTGYRGVRKQKHSNTYAACGQRDGKWVHIGNFPTAELANEAAIAFRAANYKGLVPEGYP